VPLEVKKQHPEALSPEEVERWQGIFPETPRPEEEQGKKRKKRRTARRSKAHAKRTRYQHAFDEEKDKEKEKEEKKEGGLSPEELEEWYRLFGEEPDV
jgi:hypothetical protein